MLVLWCGVVVVCFVISFLRCLPSSFLLVSTRQFAFFSFPPPSRLVQFFSLVGASGSCSERQRLT